MPGIHSNWSLSLIAKLKTNNYQKMSFWEVKQPWSCTEGLELEGEKKKRRKKKGKKKQQHISLSYVSTWMLGDRQQNTSLTHISNLNKKNEQVTSEINVYAESLISKDCHLLDFGFIHHCTIAKRG